jgi:hypothetical protein
MNVKMLEEARTREVCARRERERRIMEEAHILRNHHRESVKMAQEVAPSDALVVWNRSGWRGPLGGRCGVSRRRVLECVSCVLGGRCSTTTASQAPCED